MPKGKTAIITGGTSGIGYAIADLFTQKGTTVVICSDSREKVENTVSQLGCDGIAADISRMSECRKIVDYTAEKYGGVDILINNAGIQHICPIEDFPEEKWSYMIDLMLNAPFYLTKYCWPYMKARHWGRIINIDSVQGLVASKFKACYVAAKHGLNGLTMASALEGGEYGITVNSVCPAYADTPLMKKQVAEQAKVHNISEEEVVDRIMLGSAAIKKLVNPTDVADLCRYLCSDGAGMITGATIPIDGGWTVG